MACCILPVELPSSIIRRVTPLICFRPRHAGPDRRPGQDGRGTFQPFVGICCWLSVSDLLFALLVDCSFALAHFSFRLSLARSEARVWQAKYAEIRIAEFGRGEALI